VQATQVWFAGLQTRAAGSVQFALVRHATQISSGSPRQKGVVPAQTSLEGAQTQR
jgi:hypothetical protein